MTTTGTPSRIQIDPYLPLASYAGQPYAHTTWEGEVMVGVTEVGSSVANENRLIVRFPDGRWAFVVEGD